MESLKSIDGNAIFKKPDASTSSQVPARENQVKINTVMASTIESLRKENARLMQEMTILQMKHDRLTELVLTITNSPFSTQLLLQNGRYLGQIMNGAPSGLGVYTSFDGISYIGQWANSVFHGRGTLVDGRGTYEGFFENGNRHGWGRLVFTDGEIFEGMWEDNKFARGDYYRNVRGVEQPRRQGVSQQIDPLQ